MTTVTAVVSIGNSDDKLSQSRWSKFQAATHEAVTRVCDRIHARTHSLPDQPWQNAVWVIEMDGSQTYWLIQDLERLCRVYEQDSIALTLGNTALIDGKPPAE